jgi:hypothetical protein
LKAVRFLGQFELLPDCSDNSNITLAGNQFSVGATAPEIAGPFAFRQAAKSDVPESRPYTTIFPHGPSRTRGAVLSFSRGPVV